MPIKVGMVSLGCSKNLVDSERMLSKFRKRGYQLVTEPGLSDIAVVNTCGFIQSAKEEAIETILEICKLKEEGTVKKNYCYRLSFRALQGGNSRAFSGSGRCCRHRLSGRNHRYYRQGSCK